VRMFFPAHTTCLPLQKLLRLPNAIHSRPPKAEFLISHITLLAPDSSLHYCCPRLTQAHVSLAA
jgi:hypothetical protein